MSRHDTADRLQQLHRQLARGRKLTMMLEDLQAQLTELEDETAFLREAYLAEQAEVQRLEGESFSTLMERLMGRMERRSAAGEAELCAAAMKYETAARQLHDVQAHIAALLREKAACAEAEGAFAAAFSEERRRLSQAEPQQAAELLAVEQRIAAAEAELHEVDEALTAGARVLAAMDNAARRLSGAEGWGGVDPLSSGALAVAAALSPAGASGEDGLYSLQELLRSYRTELADVSLEAGLRMKVDGFLRFADEFFDEFFSAATAWDHILSAERRLAQAEEQVQDVQAHLAASAERYGAELERLRGQRETLLART